MPKQIDQATIKKFLHYDPETGSMHWLSHRGRVTAGHAAGKHNDNGYIVIRLFGGLYRAHRLAWVYMTGEWPENDIDHINGIRDDNRFANLREATRSQNLSNSRLKDCSTSGLKGAYWCKRRGRWYSNYTVDCKNVFLGYFDTPDEAHAAYLKKAVEVKGEFARAA